MLNSLVNSLVHIYCVICGFVCLSVEGEKKDILQTFRVFFPFVALASFLSEMCHWLLVTLL